jgi:hypothetical protein
MPPKGVQRTRTQSREKLRGTSNRFVFLNIPYDVKFENLYLAYIAGISALGLIPRATLEIPGPSRRLNRIYSLIRSCAYSIHDLCRVESDRTPPRTPRFNMPFELGMAVAWAEENTAHTWVVCESLPYRLQKSLSDLNGTDPYIHDGRIAGVFRELCNAFMREEGPQPSVQQMTSIYRVLRSSLPELMLSAGTSSPYTSRVFRDLCIVAGRAADRVVVGKS